MAFDSDDAEQYPVYLGVWTNRSRGQVMGITLTLRRQEANLLVAFTAFFIAFIATRFWRVLCFAFHRLYATAASQNAVYHQRQAILRNSSTPEGGIQQLVQLIWANRKRNGRFAPLLMVIVAVICIVTFTAAGGLSSQISTAMGTEVLIRSLNCGIQELKNVGAVGPQNFFALAPSRAEMIENAANYAQQCYSTGAARNLDCGRFVTKKLASFIDDNAACPFKEKICRSSSRNLRIDSGYISSHEQLGLNSPDRFFARNVLRCAPITITGYTSQQSTPIGNITLYHYGGVLAPSGRKDYVFAAKSIESQYAFGFSPDFPAIGGNYEVTPIYYRMQNKTVTTNSEFIPIDPMLRKDADVVLIFLSGEGVIHSAPSTDDWYRVSPTQVNVNTDDWYHVSVNNSSTNSVGVDTAAIYLPLELASPLGRAIQYQFCYSDIQHCGLLGSILDARSSAKNLFDTTLDHNDSGQTSGDPFTYFTAGFMEYQSTSIWQLIAQLGPASLASKSSLTAATQGPLPSNQWQLDVIRWWDITKASLQAAYLGIPYFNPPDPSLLRYRTNFTSQGFKTLCNNQKIRSTAYTSFSIFGLLFTFILGLLIALMSYLLETISQILHRKWGFQTFAHLEWNTNATLQFQRLAHEQLGFGTWSKGTADIPITEAGNRLGRLDISNSDHPVLYPPSKDKDKDQSSYEAPEAVTLVTSTSESNRRPSNAGSVFSHNSPSPLVEQAPQSFMPETSSCAIQPDTEVGEVQPDDRIEIKRVFHVE
ncbi:hypothetical protein GGR58DRAFT_524421 [Xylaria digitata]|nr:hypothetical protein GGR58DRAFT_524421 [Xylaria digitata]